MKSILTSVLWTLPALLAVSNCGDDNIVKKNVTLAINVVGQGKVESNAAESPIQCGKNADGNDLSTQKCSQVIDEGETITLTASPSNGSAFVIWNATTNSEEFTCLTSNVCTVTITENTSATATFVP